MSVNIYSSLGEDKAHRTKRIRVHFTPAWKYAHLHGRNSTILLCKCLRNSNRPLCIELCWKCFALFAACIRTIHTMMIITREYLTFYEWSCNKIYLYLWPLPISTQNAREQRQVREKMKKDIRPTYWAFCHDIFFFFLIQYNLDDNRALTLAELGMPPSWVLINPLWQVALKIAQWFLFLDHLRIAFTHKHTH